MKRVHKGFRAQGRKGLTTPEQDALAAAALFVVFNVECERFDETICTGKLALDGSGILPRTTTELAIIVEHAQQMSERLLARAARLGLPKRVLEAGEAFVMRMPYRRVLADYPGALHIIGGSLDDGTLRKTLPMRDGAA